MEKYQFVAYEFRKGVLILLSMKNLFYKFFHTMCKWALSR